MTSCSLNQRHAWALQIFNLMKFDSYTRFLKSPLYQECILAEVEGRSLPDSQQVPSSPASKHSVSSDHSNVSTPKKVPPGVPVGAALRGGTLCHVGFPHTGECRPSSDTRAEAGRGAAGVQPPSPDGPASPAEQLSLPRCSSSAA